MNTRPRTRRAARINVLTLGCSKNLVDSENLLTQLAGNGLEATHEADGPAEVVVVNTCGFIDRAKEESIQTILDWIDEKHAGRIEKLFVTGCLSERYREELQAEMPEVDGFFGTRDLPDLLAALGADFKHELIGERHTTTDSHYAYLKIAEGCDRPCSFCAIPLMRGTHRSRTIESLQDEARFLVSRGATELMLIAQDLTYYGLDLYGKRRLADLLEALCEVDGLRWLRLHYAFPSGFPLEVIDTMARQPKVCNYLDMPLQHAADAVLQRMRRGITRRKTLDLVAAIRERVPDIALRTTMLVGFPGETEADFEELLQFVEAVRFDRLGVFQYSHEDGTHAATLGDDVPPEVKQERADRLMALQQDISFDLNRRRIGTELLAVVDRREGQHWVGRTEYDSPEVDNEVLIDAAGQPLAPGQYVQVAITDAAEYDLFGKFLRNA
jgi:ribosomal protein S12 methylthiotransferase